MVEREVVRSDYLVGPCSDFMGFALAIMGIHPSGFPLTLVRDALIVIRSASSASY